MPQVQPGQLYGGVTVPKAYGTGNQVDTVLFREKLMKLFKPQEFVTIENITDEPCFWQYMPFDNEFEGFSEDGLQKQVTRLEPEMWVIDAHSREVIVGASAYMALDVMYKNWAAFKTLKKFRDPNSQIYDDQGKHIPRNFNLSDGGAQDEFIEKAYLGKATPATFDTYSQSAKQIQDTIDQPAVAPGTTLGQQPIGQPDAAGPRLQGRPDTPALAERGGYVPPEHPTNGPKFAPNPNQPMQEPVNTIAEAVGADKDPTIPIPKTTAGAPLVEPTYAQPDAEDVSETAAKSAKKVVASGKK